MDKTRLLRVTGLFSMLSILLASTVYAENTLHEKWDELWRDLVIDITVLGVIFAVVTIYLLVKYRRKSPDEQGSASNLKPLAAFGWVLIPAFIFMADDIFMGLKNWGLWTTYRDVPQNAYQVDVTSFMWGYEVKYPEGAASMNELRVPVGKPIHVRLASRDVIHTFFAPDFRVKWDALPGRVQSLWFKPDKTGEHVFTCTEFCGILHSGMYGKIIVMNEADFSKWLADNKPKEENKLEGETGQKEGGQS